MKNTCDCLRAMGGWNRAFVALVVALLHTLSCSAQDAEVQHQYFLPGESRTYYFASLPFLSDYETSFSGLPECWFQLLLEPADPEAELLWELFEGSIDDAVHVSGTWSLDDPWSGVQIPGGFWQDRQGAVRLTGLRGKMAVASFEVTAFVPEGDHFKLYAQTFPAVPEPGVVALLFTFVFAMLISRFWRRRA